MTIAIITGGSRGLGKNAALKLADKGTDIILTFNTKEAEAFAVVSEIEKKGRKAHAIQLNAADSKTFDSFADKVKSVLKEKWNTDKFDYLINNAGIGMNALATQTTEDQFDQLMNIHLKGPYFLTQKLLPLMKDGGRILNVSTGLTRFCVPGYSAYASMKGAIEVYTKYLAKELGQRKIAVNVLAPGAIETDFGGGHSRDNAELNKFLASQTALGRVGLPDDIGDVITAILSPETHWVNAQRIEASGGMFL
jgi:NAD(P)-dependent dehydrogenase (short-subunit alcohol dehydrogenase family)